VEVVDAWALAVVWPLVVVLPAICVEVEGCAVAVEPPAVAVLKPTTRLKSGRLPAPQGPRLFLWDVGGGGFFGNTGARPVRSRKWKRPGRYRVGVRAGDQLDAGEGFTTVVVTPRRSHG